jgi:hypothetical protein
MTVTPTQLRENLYKILDQVIETQQPIEILRKGQIVKLVAEQAGNHNKLSNLKAHPNFICTDPDTFVELCSNLVYGKNKLGGVSC